MNHFFFYIWCCKHTDNVTVSKIMLVTAATKWNVGHQPDIGTVSKIIPALILARNHVHTGSIFPSNVSHPEWKPANRGKVHLSPSKAPSAHHPSASKEHLQPNLPHVGAEDLQLDWHLSAEVFYAHGLFLTYKANIPICVV